MGGGGGKWDCNISDVKIEIKPHNGETIGNPQKTFFNSWGVLGVTTTIAAVAVATAFRFLY
jgi:hypothetical protein